MQLHTGAVGFADHSASCHMGQKVRDGFHVVCGDVLKAAVEVFAAGAQVRAGEALKGQACAVRAAADGDDLRRDADGFHRIFRVLDQEHTRDDSNLSQRLIIFLYFIFTAKKQ